MKANNRRSLEVVSLENHALREKVDLMRALKGQTEQQKLLLSNSMAAIVQNLFRQANITSFNPIIQNNVYAPLTLNFQVLMYAYTTHGILQTAIDQVVFDAFRGGVEVESESGDLDSKDLKKLENFMRTENFYEEVIDTMIWTRTFGGGAAIIGIEGQHTKDPLDIAAIKKGTKVKIYDASRWELGSSQKEADRYNFYGEDIHPSRVIRICGKRAPWLIRRQLGGWGLSEIQRMQEPFNLFLRTMNVIYDLLQEAKVDVYRLKNLNTNAQNPVGMQLVQTRIEQANQLKSYQNALVLDTDDEYVQKQITFSGLAEMSNQARINFAASLNMPMTKLFGLSATGFNSGEDDMENYNSKVESDVREPAQQLVRTVLQLAAASLFGYPHEIGFKYRPLRLLKATEDEEVKSKKHERWLGLYDRGMMTPKELADAEHKDGLVPAELEQSSEGAPAPEPPMLGVEDEEAGPPKGDSA